MHKLPKDVMETLNNLEAGGVVAYAAGEAVASAILDTEVLDMDIVALGSKDDITDLLPEANVSIIENALIPVGTQGSNLPARLIRVEFPEVEGEAPRPIIDIYPIGSKEDITNPEDAESIVSDFLKTAALNFQALAYHPTRGIVDPTDARSDMQHKLIKGNNINADIIKGYPALMLDAIRFAAENDFDIQGDLYRLMVECSESLKNVDVSLLRMGLESIIVSDFAGKGLRMLAGANLMPAIIGDKAVNLNARQRGNFSIVCENIHKTKPVALRRLGLLYLCFDEKKGEDAINYLDYDEVTKKHLMDGLYLLDRLTFIKHAPELKDFMVEVGRERYEYLENLAKAVRIIYDGTEFKLLSRYYILKFSKEAGDPIWVEDLAINEDDLMAEFSDMSREEAYKMLVMLTDIVHRKPRENVAPTLIKYAKKFKRSKFAQVTRRVKWLR